MTLDRLADDFTRRLESIIDPALRSKAAAERIKRLQPAVAADLLESIWQGACANHRPSQTVFLDFASNIPLTSALGYDFSRALYEACRQIGLGPVARLLLSPQRLEPESLEANNQFPDAELGRRKAWARGRDREIIDRLLWDPEPSVIEILLNNAIVVERDVVAIAARRPTSPDCLMAVFRHYKWLSRTQVKLALAANPYLPSDAALALLPFLTEQDLRWLVNQETLAHNVRVVADQLVKARRSHHQQ